MTAEDYYKYAREYKTYTNYGSEARVIKHQDRVAKLFKPEKTEAFMASKEAKIKNLIVNPIEGFAKPIDLIYSTEGKFAGYTMEFVNHDKDVFDICNKEDEEITLKQKIAYLKKVEALIKQTHEAGYILNDCAIWNFLVQEGSIIGIDCDNFQFDKFTSETHPRFYLNYYKQLCNQTESSFNSDKFSYGVWALNSLLKYPMKNDDNFLEYREKSNYTAIKMRNLLVPEETKLKLIEFFSQNPEKMWMSEILENIKENDKTFIHSI